MASTAADDAADGNRIVSFSDAKAVRHPMKKPASHLSSHEYPPGEPKINTHKAAIESAPKTQICKRPKPTATHPNNR
jgi:hypothetical protein